MNLLRHCPVRVRRAAGLLVASFALAGLICSYVLVREKNEPPIADLPEVLNLGSHEIGEIVVVPFSVANRGGNTLVIDEIRSTCSCSGIERKEGEKFLRVERLELKAGETTQAVMRVAVRGVPVGGSLQLTVSCRTNDPTKPEAKITVVVDRATAGVQVTPNAFGFGKVDVQQKVSQVMVVRDTAVPPRAIDHVSVKTTSGRVRATLLTAEECPEIGISHDGSTVIGCVHVEVDTVEAGATNAKVSVHLVGEDRKPDDIVVFGEIQPLVEIEPAFLLLPRQAAQGVVRSAICTCRSRRGEPVELAVEQSAEGVMVELDNQSSKGTIAVRVTVDPPPRDLVGPRVRRVIRLRAKVGDQVCPLSLTILSP